jgi:AAA+ superfamily predicted ATPase
MIRKPCRQVEVLIEAERFCKHQAKSFSDEAEVLDALGLLVRLRTTPPGDHGGTQARRLSGLAKQATAIFHERLDHSPSTLQCVKLFRGLELNVIEREILLVLIASEFGIVPSVRDIEDLQKVMNRQGADSLAIARALTNEATLVTSEAVLVDEDAPRLRDRPIHPSRHILEPFLQGSESFPGWQVATPDHLWQKCYPLFRALNQRSEALTGHHRHFFLFPGGNLEATNRKIAQMTKTVRRTLDRHPDWPASRISMGLQDPELQIAIALIGKELGFLDVHDELFTGDGLARCASEHVPMVASAIRHLRRDEALRSAGFARVCGGPGDAEAHEDDSVLRLCEFELTPEFIAELGICEARRRKRTRHKPRTPLVKLEDLVLSENTRSQLEMLISQLEHSSVLLDDWGFRQTLPYGRGATMIFSGPPGTGKTACAEGIAHRLEKPILSIDYSQIQNCFVGETEKNIVAVFREASESNAVLFWDEADAMFFDRDSAYRNWEVREVNVLLQELEHFEGVCILCTNRKLTLDPALERRISLKVEFERPTRPMRAQIWRKLVPQKLPLAADVDFERLALHNMTGGEIKNALLNAARIALVRAPKGTVAMADFDQAIAMEVSGCWAKTGSRSIGFDTQGRIQHADLQKDARPPAA